MAGTQTLTGSTAKSISNFQAFVREHALMIFFILTFVLAWMAVSPLLLSKAGLLALPPDLPIELFLIAGALAGPTLSAYIVTALTEGWTGVRQLMRRYVQWRVGLGWYLFVYISPILTLTLGAILFLGFSILTSLSQNWSLLLSLYLPVSLVGILFGPLWEEPGWRGFALPRLQQRYGALPGTLILGVLWSLWHLPGFFGGWLGPFTLSSFSALLLGTTAMAFVLAWVYNHTQGSLLIMILFHAALNAASTFGGKILPSEISATVRPLVESGWIPAVTYTLWALLTIIVTKGSLSYHPDS